MQIAVRIHSEPTILCILHCDLSCLCNLLTRLYVVVCSMLVQKPIVNLCGCHVLVAKSTSLCASLLVCLLEVHIFPLVYFCTMHVQNSEVSFLSLLRRHRDILRTLCVCVYMVPMRHDDVSCVRVLCLCRQLIRIVYVYCARDKLCNESSFMYHACEAVWCGFGTVHSASAKMQVLLMCSAPMHTVDVYCVCACACAKFRG